MRRWSVLEHEWAWRWRREQVLALWHSSVRWRQLAGVLDVLQVVAGQYSSCVGHSRGGASLGLYVGTHVAVYHGVRVTGWGVNECRRCGKVFRGWHFQLKRHINSKRCVVGGSATAAAAAPGAAHTPHSTSVNHARAAHGKTSPTTDRTPIMPSCSTRGTKRPRTLIAGTSTICDGNGHSVHTGRQHQPTFHHAGGSSVGSSRASQPARLRARQQARESGVACVHGAPPTCSHARCGGSAVSAEPSTTIDGGVGWGHGFTVTGSGLKVPLAPMPSRCKRARRVRVSGGSTSATVGCDVGACGPASSSSGPMVV